MIYLSTRIFPAAAVLISVFAFLFPMPLARLGAWVVPLLAVIMFGMGATLSPREFLSAIRKPKAVILGVLIQFMIMPLLAYGLGHLLQLPRNQLIGLVLVGTVAGGTASNVIAYLAGGDVALSITMTACSTVCGIFLTPLLAALYLGQTVEVPAAAMFRSIFMIVALPVGLGLIAHRVMKGKERLVEIVCPLLSMAGILLVIAVIIALNHDTLKDSGARVFLAIFLHNGGGLAFGYTLARLFRCDRRTAITIAIETGMQNSGLATALAKQFFGAAAALPGAIFSVWHNLSGALLAAAAKKYITGKSSNR